MSRWIEKNGNHQVMVIVAVTAIVIATAYALAESVSSGHVSFEILLIFLLIAPSVCLPVIAFRSHSTAKKVSNEIIRAKNLQLNLVLDNMAQGLCMFDGDQRLIVCNQRYAEMYGLSPEIVQPGTTFREILQNRIDTGVFSGEDHESYIRERLAAVSERNRSAKVQQLSDGRSVSISHTPMPDGGWIATHEDITGQMRSEMALMESEARFRAIFDNAPFCVNLKDMEGRYLFVNNRYEEWWGIAATEAIGKKNEEFNNAPDRPQNAGAIENSVLESGQPCEREIHTRHPVTGKSCHRLIAKFPVNAPDGTMMAIGTISVDITERKHAEEELIRHRDHLQDLVHAATHDLKQQARELETALEREKELNELQRQFVAMASHEFRTPLAINDSTAQRLKKTNGNMTSEDLLRRTDNIRNAVNRMTQLMESTLTAARMEEGKVKFEISDCNIAGLLREVCERQGEVSPTHMITCDVSALPPSIKADASALEQIFTNLVGNAVKYAPEFPHIEVAASVDGSDVVITVTDHGVGIDPDDLARIGERFFRAKSSMGIAGTGIGLNLVKTLTEMHEGSVSIESTPGKGSTFAIRLPVAGPAQAAQNQDQAASNAA